MHGGGRELHAGGDAGRAEPLASAQPEDALLEPSGGPPGAVGGDAGPVDQAGLAELLVAAPPAVGSGPGDAHLVGDVGGRPSRLGGDPSDQGQPPRGVSRALAWGMRPPVSAVPSASPHLTRRPHLTSTTSMGRTPSSELHLWRGARDLNPPNRQIRSLVLCVDLVGSRPIWPAHVGGLVDLVGSSRVPSDRLDDQPDDQGARPEPRPL
jgi:hypothetical protein